MEKSELEAKQIFDFVGYQYNLREGKVKPTLERWQTLNLKIQELVNEPCYRVRQLMYFIGLLTAKEKQAHLDQLHMRPIPWHQKNSRITKKSDPDPKIYQFTLKVVAPRGKCLSGSATTATRLCTSDFTDARREGWGVLLADLKARGT